MADGSPLSIPAELDEELLCEHYHTLPRAGGLDNQFLTLRRGKQALQILRAFAAFANCKSFTEISAADWTIIQELQKADPELK